MNENVVVMYIVIFVSKRLTSLPYFKTHFFGRNVKIKFFHPLKRKQFECMFCTYIEKFHNKFLWNQVAPTSITSMQQSLSSFEDTHNRQRGSHLRTLSKVPTLGLFSTV